MIRLIIFLCSSFFILELRAAVVTIGIFTESEITSLLFTPHHGSYNILTDDGKTIFLNHNDIIQCTIKDSVIEVKTFLLELGIFRSIKIIAAEPDSRFRARPVSPFKGARIFDDDVEINIYENKLRIVNRVNIDKYIAGVTRSEVGEYRVKEFYKVQAVICRTFALSNLRRHEAENFQLCDMVHCQAYNGACTDIYDILSASYSTSGVVLVDEHHELINASYHSNCGGRTMNSEDVWSTSLPHLRSVEDTFCYVQRNAAWEARIPAEDWKDYFAYKFNDTTFNGQSINTVTNYFPPKKELYYKGNRQIPMTQIRKDWNFRSADFSVREVKDTVVISGKGYGHGVGLCQEGAIRMAGLGYSFRDILMFYYTNVVLFNMNRKTE